MISTKNKKLKPKRHTASSLLWVTLGTKRQYLWSSFIYYFFYPRPFDQELWSSLIYLFYLLTVIWRKCMILFHFFFLLQTTARPKYVHLFFLLRTTIRPKIMVFIDLFFLFTHDHSTKIYGPLSFILSFANDRSTRIYGSLSFIVSFVHDHSCEN